MSVAELVQNHAQVGVDLVGRRHPLDRIHDVRQDELVEPVGRIDGVPEIEVARRRR